ncbi:uncharacterized, partial [Tachysurus ichikawai]
MKILLLVILYLIS